MGKKSHLKENTNLKKLKDEIIVNMDMKQGILTFIIGEESSFISDITIEQNLVRCFI